MGEDGFTKEEFEAKEGVLLVVGEPIVLVLLVAIVVPIPVAFAVLLICLDRFKEKESTLEGVDMQGMAWTQVTAARPIELVG